MISKNISTKDLFYSKEIRHQHDPHNQKCTSGISESKAFSTCVPMEQAGFSPAEYTGLFFFRFWRYGKLVSVVSTRQNIILGFYLSCYLQVVDDLIPCLDRVPLFTQSHDEGEVCMQYPNADL